MLRVTVGPRTRVRTAWAAAILALSSSVIGLGTVARASAGPGCGPSTVCADVVVGLTSLDGGTAPQPFSVTITNEQASRSNDPINIVTLTPPPLWTVTAATTSVSAATVSLSGGAITVSGLVLNPGDSLTMTVTLAAVPCATGSDGWTAAVAENPDNNGADASTFQVDPASTLTTTVGTGCKLVFQPGPADAQVNTTITSISADPTGPPLGVVVDTALGTVAPVAVPLTLAISPGTGAAVATLAGATTATTADGLATFAPTINASGLGYMLTASSTAPGVAAATSSPFDIDDVLTPCPAGGCVGSDSNNAGTSTSISTSSGGAGDTLAISIGVQSISCGDYPIRSGVVTFSVGGTGDEVVTLDLSRSAIDPSGTAFGVDLGLARRLQVCYGSDTQGFLDRFHSWVPPGSTGLLPRCQLRRPEAPCVWSRELQENGDVVIRFIAPAGDPRFAA